MTMKMTCLIAWFAGTAVAEGAAVGPGDGERPAVAEPPDDPVAAGAPVHAATTIAIAARRDATRVRTVAVSHPDAPTILIVLTMKVVGW